MTQSSVLTNSLPEAPQAVVGPDGKPLFGRYAGLATQFDWARLGGSHARNALWRRFHHKRWHYVALGTDDVFCAVAIINLGWASSCFAYAFDRRDEDMLANFSLEGWSGAARVAQHAQGRSVFSAKDTHIIIECGGDGRYRLELASPYLEIDAQFGPPTAPLLLATGPIEGGAVHATQKSSGMPLSGEVRLWRGEYRLDGGVASFDYSNGLLARHTAWRWASGHDLELGFNLQAGYFGAHENALWLDGQVHPLAAAHFIYDRHDPLSSWHIFTEDDLLELVFTPEGARRQNKNLVVAASKYLQPIGTFTGWVRASADAPKRVVSKLAGVTEDHTSTW